MTRKSKSQHPSFLSEDEQIANYAIDDVTEMMLGFRMTTKRRNQDGDVIE